MRFEIVSPIANIETIAFGSGVRDSVRLRKMYGKGRWRKMKGIAKVKLLDGTIHTANFIGMKLTESANGISNSNLLYSTEGIWRISTHFPHDLQFA